MKEEGLEEEEGEGFFPPHFIICSCCFGVWNSLDLVVKGLLVFREDKEQK